MVVIMEGSLLELVSGVVVVLVGLIGVVCHVEDVVSVHSHIVMVLVKVGYLGLVVGGIEGEVGVIALEVGDEEDLVVDVVGCVEYSLVVVECGVVGIVVGV